MAMDLRTLAHVNMEACRHLAQARQLPYLPHDVAEVAGYLVCRCQRRLPFPLIGDHRPRGWRLVDVVRLDERTLRRPRTARFRRLLARFRGDLASKQTIGYAIIQSDGGRVTLGVFAQNLRRRPR